MKQPAPLILAADIGGTNTRVALLDGTNLRVESIARYENAKASGLEDILRDYLKQNEAKPEAVSLALAGPVNGDQGTLTNLDWSITTQGARDATGCTMGVLLNDLQAQGHALPYLSDEAFRSIQAAPKGPNNASCLMIGVGTGLNVAPVHQLAGRTFVPAAEAGHTNFCPQDAALIALGDDLHRRLGHVAAEDILSGRGLERAYRHTSGLECRAQDIMTKCGEGDVQADEAVGLVIRTLGHFAGDMALTHLPFGGIFLVGGVARALMPYMSTHDFCGCFAAKGRFSEFMAKFSINLVEDDYAALIGAASYAQECLHRL